MNDKKCLNCGEKIDQPKKGREKLFCNVTCRSNYWQKEQRKVAKLHRKKTSSTAIGEMSKKTNTESMIANNHPKYDPKDPIEGSAGFYLKYGVFTYDEIKD